MHPKLVDIFDAARELPEAQRDTYLDEACAGDDALRREVETLLASLDTAGDFLAEPDRAAPHLDEEDAHDLEPGTTVGSYTIVERIGGGGSSAVYRATQSSPLERTVALKVLRHPCGGAAIAEQFEAERRMLVRLDHAAVAVVFDAGATDDGRPFFAMELVDGHRITSYCDAEGLDLDARAALFVELCDAVHHCHRRGVVHCDLKPANVLVSSVDGAARLKVIDFGIARALQAEAGEQRSVLGTPRYMAPEQLDGDAAIDTRVDVHALGVLLDDLVAPSAHRELGWIIERATAERPIERYDSASALGADVARWRRNEAVDAAPDDLGYLLRKTISRHRLAARVTLGMVALVIIALVGFFYGWREAERGRELADALGESEREGRLAAEGHAVRAEQTVQYLVDLLVQLDPWVSASSSAETRAAIETAEAQLETAFAGNPTAEANVRAAIGNARVSLGEYERGEAHLLRAWMIWDGRPPSTLLGYDVAWSLADAAGHLERNARDWVDRARTFRVMAIAEIEPELEAVVRRIHWSSLEATSTTVLDATEPGDTVRRLYADAVIDLGYELWYDVDESALPVVIEALRLQRLELPDGHPEIGMTASLVGDLLNWSDRADEARDHLDHAIALLRGALPPDHVEITIAEARLGECLRRLGELDDAEAILVEADDALRTQLGRTAGPRLRSLASRIRCARERDDAATTQALRDELALAIADCVEPPSWLDAREAFAPPINDLDEPPDPSAWPTGRDADDLSRVRSEVLELYTPSWKRPTHSSRREGAARSSPRSPSARPLGPDQIP